MRFLTNIQPRYIIASTLAVALLMFGSAYLELSQSRSELLHVLQEHSLSLAETIERGSANVVLSTEQIEHQLGARLLNNAYYIARLDSLNLLTRRDLQTFAAANDIYRINIFNGRGERLLGSHDSIPHVTAPGEKFSPREILKPILGGRQKTLIIGLRQARFEEGQRYAVAIRRTKPGGGAIVLNLDAAELVEFRKRIGIGKLVKDLGDNNGIDYVVLQDREGILAATSQVQEMSSVDRDSVLTLAAERDTVFTRQVDFQGHQTFEVVKRLTIEGSTAGVLRIGLSMDELRSSEDRMKRRLLIISIVLIAIGALVFTAIVVSQNYKLVSHQYALIQSFTGNILENMRDAVVTVDGENRITIFNREAEELFAVDAKSVTGKRLEGLAEIGARCLQPIFEAADQELVLECSPGQTRVVYLTHSHTRKPDGSLESHTVVIKDLTEARRLEREIQRKDKLTAMGGLASGVAHEVRNPLNAISMIAQRFEREFVPRSDVKEYRALTNVLKKESARVNGIVQQFLQFARPPKVELKETPAGEFIAHVSTLFGAQAKEKGVRFSSHAHLDGVIRVDAAQMTQAMLNLLQNALDATPKGGAISLEVNRNGGYIVFEVTDDGVGIPADRIERVFDLYFTTKPNGTGMGLAITQQIVTQHHGTMDVESGPTQGTTFSISIPI
ncbi:MAG: ATP-binding protein [Ignavibacteriales bacterium]|nr:ATP-binding protein [Ignavibacteriales bacterium]